jgi:hypothetical protein
MEFVVESLNLKLTAFFLKEEKPMLGEQFTKFTTRRIQMGMTSLLAALVLTLAGAAVVSAQSSGNFTSRVQSTQCTMNTMTRVFRCGRLE